ncbi:flippase [Marinoscillum furvescens]|uniref:O-antigen/teichoic acid export membrane protein n=1 Tax=Marinoscillum furvescens DSM 4134 TaxID=1122208 RepID=A0A3D9KZS2_MARFU|nr:flippase [Marinoscillum furvescens]RED95656.1 O-antigen/teichoic acid export membrane protein [Marinoscillum furvescens DSM 4134]
MGKQSYWIQAGKLTLFQRLAMLGFGVLNFYLLVRMLPQEGYGVWMLFVSVTTLIHTIREGFFKKPLIRFLGKLEGVERRRLQGSSFILNLAFAGASSLILAVGANGLQRVWDAPGLEQLFYIYILTNCCWAVFAHYNNVQEAHFRFIGPMTSGVLKNGVLFVGIVTYYFSNWQIDIVTLGVLDLVATGIAAVTAYWFGKGLAKRKVFWSKSWAYRLFHYGKYTLGTNISGIILRNTDSWMLAWFISPAAVAVYNVAIRVTNLFEVPTMAMASILFPKAVKNAEVDDQAAMKELYEKSVSVIIMFVAPMAILGIIFSDQIIWVLAGEAYGEASAVLKVTMLYGLIIPFNKQMGILLDAIGKARLNMLFVMRNAAINATLNALIIPMVGVMGAAYATLSTMLLVFIINQIYLWRNFQVNLKNLPGYSKQYFLRLKQLALSKVPF